MPARSRLILLLIGALVVLALGGWAGWSWRHPHDLAPPGGIVITQGGAVVGRTVYFGVSYGPDKAHSITLRSARPDTTLDTARASVEVLVCWSRRGGGIGTATEADVRRFCDLRPVAGATLSGGPGRREQLLVAITPHAAGRVVVPAVDVTYDSGWRHGTQRTGARVALVTARPAS